MCDNKLQIIFDELYRKTRPCVRITNESLVKALKLAKEHCFALDGCCSSRVKVSICDFEKILTNPCNEDEKAIQAYFQCPESTRSCCDCLNDNNGDHDDDGEHGKDGHGNDDHEDEDHDHGKDKDKDGKNKEDKNDKDDKGGK